MSATPAAGARASTRAAVTARDLAKAHRVRLLLSALTIMLGVASVAGALMFTDTGKHAPYDTFAQAAGKAHVVVSATGGSEIPQDVLTTMRGVEGIAHVAGRVVGRSALQDSHGKLIRETYRTTIVNAAVTGV